MVNRSGPAGWNHMANRRNSGETGKKLATKWRILLKNNF
jgi:hypothetical protein